MKGWYGDDTLYGENGNDSLNGENGNDIPEIELAGVALSPFGEILTGNKFGLPYSSGLYAGADIGSRGKGGTLTLETDRLSLRDGAVVQTSTFGDGDAGNLIIKATDAVELVGTFADERFPTSLSAFSGSIPGIPGVVNAKGKGGNLTIQTGELILRERAAVTASSLNSTSEAKGAGNLQIQAQTILLDNKATITSGTNSGQGGALSLYEQRRQRKQSPNPKAG